MSSILMGRKLVFNTVIARHVVPKQSSAETALSGLLRRVAPRNDECPVRMGDINDMSSILMGRKLVFNTVIARHIVPKQSSVETALSGLLRRFASRNDDCPVRMGDINDMSLMERKLMFNAVIARHVVPKQSSVETALSGLLRRFAPRNDECPVRKRDINDEYN